ncbi:MAG: serine/threonine protein kinase, partial [Myxococcales bacterium]
MRPWPRGRKRRTLGALVISYTTTVDVLGSTQVGPSSHETPVPSAPTSDRWIGASLDHFEVRRALGRGGMGAVYLAHDRSLDRLVAIKVLPDELSGQAELQQRFVREAQAQARLSSPHVVAIYFIGRAPSSGSLYFAMEYVEGESLEALIDRREAIDPETARRWMVDVVRGLRDAHRAGIVHRDVKPSNLLRDAHGTIKLVDFGLAKPLDGDKKITRDGVLLGSPLYMAPEQARGDAVDHRADMYSLGCTFYHLLTGAPAFDGPTPLAVVTRHVADPPPRVRER